MWQRILHFFRKPAADDTLLTEFEDTLMLVVDPEQLTNNLLSKLKELISVEKAFVYLADQSESARSFSLVDKTSGETSQLPDLPINSRITRWFHTNRQILFCEGDEEVSKPIAVDVRTVKGGLNPLVGDTMTIDVYDTACLATIGKGLAVDNPTDFDGNCITDLADLAVLATKWLNDTGLTAPVAQ